MTETMILSCGCSYVVNIYIVTKCDRCIEITDTISL